MGTLFAGEMREWLNRADSKSVELFTVPRVQIPLSPFVLQQPLLKSAGNISADLNRVFDLLRGSSGRYPMAGLHMVLRDRHPRISGAGRTDLKGKSLSLRNI